MNDFYQNVCLSVCACVSVTLCILSMFWIEDIMVCLYILAYMSAVSPFVLRCVFMCAYLGFIYIYQYLFKV